MYTLVKSIFPPTDLIQLSNYLYHYLSFSYDTATSLAIGATVATGATGATRGHRGYPGLPGLPELPAATGDPGFQGEYIEIRIPLEQTLFGES